MSVAVNGIAHIQLTVTDPDRCIPFWEKLCHFLEMKTLIKGDGIVYCIGSRTGILIRGATEEHRDTRFDQNRAGLHHFCFRCREREDIDAIHRFVVDELDATIVHGPEEGGFAPGYYSILFEDPDGLRVEFNHVPGKGHLDPSAKRPLEDTGDGYGGLTGPEGGAGAA